jgi:catechol-2,3-dioxygenase
MQKRRLLVAWSFALASSTPALAQVAPPNDMGVALGHIHVAVKDVEAQRQFWTTLGNLY